MENIIKQVLANDSLSEAEKALELATQLLHSIKCSDQKRLTHICNELTELGIFEEVTFQSTTQSSGNW